ncbi:NAD(P)-dependent oxidoreductase [Sphingomonas sp. SUN019]|uniref:NAD-dependent epimerase/dehydratase family protein n=1 Tax=Sphingomonas sp. SUN019 TaxID=2937788 RepID=UPI002164109D|nr:NAD(P)-dependent oxidoreductase [Sphingomonas sp. SUN019]UVO51694.1 NAD(P)-dependent oxidoreductase [Sphingomonas sp. SUN019]
MTERVLITGGAGFIGARLAARHLAEGSEVHIVVRPGSSSLGIDGVTTHAIDLSDRYDVEDCVAAARPTLIYHLASDSGRGNPPPEPNRRALLGDLDNLIALLAAAVSVRPPLKAFIRAGSLAEYGDGATPSDEDQREQPLSPYTAAMVAGAHYCRMLQPQLPFPVRTARLALTYGPGQSRTFLLPWLIDRCLAGEDSMINAPLARRDMIFIEDAIDGLRRLAAADRAGCAIVNLSSGMAPTVRDIADLVARSCGYDPARLHFGNAAGRGARTIWGSNARAFAQLGWRPAVSLRDGVARTVRAHRAARLPDRVAVPTAASAMAASA